MILHSSELGMSISLCHLVNLLNFLHKKFDLEVQQKTNLSLDLTISRPCNWLEFKSCKISLLSILLLLLVHMNHIK